MGKPYSMDLRERVVRAVEADGLSRRQAAEQFGVAFSTAINWVRRLRETGSAAPGQMGGHKSKKIIGETSRRFAWYSSTGKLYSTLAHQARRSRKRPLS